MDIAYSIETGNHQSLSFESKEEVINWVEAERQYWNWLREAPSPPFGNTRQINTYLQKCWDELQRYKSSHEDSAFEGAFQNIRQNLAKTDGYILEQSPDALVINRLHEEGRNLEAQAAALFCANLPFSPQGNRPILASIPPEIFSGCFQIMSYRCGLDRRSSDAVFELETAKSEYTKAIGALKRQISKLDTASSERLTAIDSLTEKQRQAHQELMAEQAHQLAAQQDEVQARLDGLEKLYREKLALRAPIEYWKGRNKRHGRFAWISLAILVIFAILGGTILFVVWSIAFQEVSAAGKEEYWMLGLVGILGALVAWFVQMFSRLTMSNFHLASDAGERVVMIETYLALLEGNHLHSDTEKKLILEAIFRSTSTGLIKEDGVPPSVLDLVSRATK